MLNSVPHFLKIRWTILKLKTLILLLKILIFLNKIYTFVQTVIQHDIILITLKWHNSLWWNVSTSPLIRIPYNSRVPVEIQCNLMLFIWHVSIVFTAKEAFSLDWFAMEGEKTHKFLLCTSHWQKKKALCVCLRFIVFPFIYFNLNWK